MFYDEGAVVVASTYTKVGGVYDDGFRHDPARPLETLADYCAGCYTNLNLPSRVETLTRYLRDYDANGLLINSVKSCNSFSAGQLLILREVEKRTGRPGRFIEPISSILATSSPPTLWLPAGQAAPGRDHARRVHRARGTSRARVLRR